MRIVATTVIRRVPPGECSGRLLTLDLLPGGDARVAELLLPHNRFRGVDPNRRGGTRGLRCVALDGDSLLVTDATGIFTVSVASGAVTGHLEHPMLGGTHTVATDGDALWVVSTHADTVLRLDRQGRELARWRPTDCHSLVELLQPPQPVAPELMGDFRDPRRLVGHVHDVAHLNTLVVGDDHLLISLGNVLTTHPAGAPETPVTRHTEFRADSWQQAPGALAQGTRDREAAPGRGQAADRRARGAVARSRVAPPESRCTGQG